MTYLPKDKWNQLDDLLNDAGACGYHDCCNVLKNSIKVMAKLRIEKEKDLNHFLTWLESCNDFGILFEKLSIYTSLLEEKTDVEDHRKLLRCRTCGKPYVNAIDSRTGKISKHLYKGNCEHIPKNIRISRG